MQPLAYFRLTFLLLLSRRFRNRTIGFLRIIGAALLVGGALELAAQPVRPKPKAQAKPAARTLSGAEKRIVGSSNDFAYRIFGALRRPAPGTNLFISPLSISAALAMAYNGAAGSTKAAMQQTLGFRLQTDPEINQSFQRLFQLLGAADQQVTFKAANSIWHNQKYRLQAPFVQHNRAGFGATVQGLDFASPNAKDVINAWASASTRGRIPSIIEQTTAADVFILVNAIYFKGRWAHAFDPRDTRPMPFHLEDGRAAEVDFMHLNHGPYRLYRDSTVAVVDLPYGNGRFSMTLVVPQNRHTLAEVASRLGHAQLTGWLAKSVPTGLGLWLPKFKLTDDHELTETLTQLGMGVAFTEQANFSQMVQGTKNGLAISKVLHKTFLEVNEEGTEAAAVTAVVGGLTGGIVRRPLLLDRPFVFLIREKSSGAVLFIGQLTKP